MAPPEPPEHFLRAHEVNLEADSASSEARHAMSRPSDAASDWDKAVVKTHDVTPRPHPSGSRSDRARSDTGDGIVETIGASRGRPGDFNSLHDVALVPFDAGPRPTRPAPVRKLCSGRDISGRDTSGPSISATDEARPESYEALYEPREPRSPVDGGPSLPAHPAREEPSNLSERPVEIAPKSGEAPTKPRHRPPVAWPGATPVLERPFLNISGPRHIPRLVSANGIPFLRIKKPQPDYLTRVLRNKIKQREKRLLTIQRLTETVSLAEEENRWDDLVVALAATEGVEEHAEPIASTRSSWTAAIETSIAELASRHSRFQRKNRQIATKMTEIIDQEKRLAEKEERERASAASPGIETKEERRCR